MEYLGKHGKVVSDKVVYDTDKDGPFKGMKNGDRKYYMDFTNGINLGSYHIIDGAKAWISYSGTRKTCGRCQNTAGDCPGGAVVKHCESRNGQRVALRDHMKKHWASIGFDPSTFNLVITEDDETVNETADVEIKSNNAFKTPHKNKQEEAIAVDNFKAVAIKNLPENIPDEEITAFLNTKGLKPSEGKLAIKRNKKNTAVDVNDIDDGTAKEIIKNIHEKVFFNKTVYCRGIISLDTPEKEAPTKPSTEVVETRNTIPGLANEEVKKAEKNKKKKVNKNKIEKNVDQMNKSDFLSEPMMENYVFEDDPKDSDEEETDNVSTANKPGFFTKSPSEVDPSSFLTPSSFQSRSAKLIQKEETWKSRISKRLLSPTETDDRRMRSKSFCSSQF